MFFQSGSVSFWMLKWRPAGLNNLLGHLGFACFNQLILATRLIAQYHSFLTSWVEGLTAADHIWRYLGSLEGLALRVTGRT